MKQTPEADLWYTSSDWQEFAKAIYSPIVQKGLSKILMQGLPIGLANGTVEQEALQGAASKGFNNFYREIVKLTIVPNRPQAPQMSHQLQPDPLIPVEETK